MSERSTSSTTSTPTPKVRGAMSDLPNFEDTLYDAAAFKASLIDRLEDLKRREPALLRKIQWCHHDLARATNDYTTLMWLISVHRDELKSLEEGGAE